MRKGLGIVLVVIMTLPALAALGLSELEYRDDFGEVSYDGSDGNLDWGDPWVEGGESDGPSKGAIHVGAENCANNNCLHMENAGVTALTRSASRRADLSEFATARLSYEIDVEPRLLSTGMLYVEAKANDSGWTTVASYLLLNIAGAHSKSHDVSPFIGSDFELRYRLTGLLGGDAVAIDRVVVAGEPATPTSSSSTTSTTSPTPSTSTSSSSSTSSTSSTTSTTTPGGATSTSGPASPGQGSSNGDTSTGGVVASPGTTVAEDTQIEDGQTTTTTASTPSGGAASFTGGSGPTPPGETGLRETGELLIADLDPGLFDLRDPTGIEVLGASVDADFSLAVEVFERIKIWFAVLALLIVTAVASGGERRRWKKVVEGVQGARPLS